MTWEYFSIPAVILYRYSEMKMVYIGLDIGGSHIGVGVVDESGSVISKDGLPIDGSLILPDQLTIMLKKAIDLCIQPDTNLIVRAIGIGCPGQSKNGVLVAASNIPRVVNFPLAAQLSKIYNDTPTFLLNDADAAISAEVFGKWTGANYQKYENLVMLTLGTGIGCGLVLNRQLYRGSNGLIEAGHMIVCDNTDANICPCGQRGCVEMYSSAKNISTRLQQLLQKSDTSDTPYRNENNSGDDLIDTSNINGKVAFEMYLAGDIFATEVLKKVSSPPLALSYPPPR